MLQLILSVLLTAVLLIWDRKLLLMFGASENTIDYAVAYMDIYAVGTIFVQLTLGLNAFITAQGFAKTGMLTVIIGAAANIVPVSYTHLDVYKRQISYRTNLIDAFKDDNAVYSEIQHIDTDAKGLREIADIAEKYGYSIYHLTQL